MKFCSGVLAVALTVGGVSAFVSPHNQPQYGHVESAARKVPQNAGYRHRQHTQSSFSHLSMGLFDGMMGSTTSNKHSKESIQIPPPREISEGQVRSLFCLWNDALATGDSRIVARRFAPDAVFIASDLDEPLVDNASIQQYFKDFLALKPQGVIVNGNIKIGNGFCKDSGVCEFTFGKDGSKTKARYSFLYTFDQVSQSWQIAHYHCSFMPESVITGSVEISKQQVENLFHLWNDALATEDADAVAKRYSKNAVLLPTVSDEPRTDYASIREYYQNFLLLQPQGRVLESHVRTGPDWAKDVGIVELTMGATGSKVKTRYSFVYTREDGEWKIAHHQLRSCDSVCVSFAFVA